MLYNHRIVNTETGEYYDPEKYIIAYGRFYSSWQNVINKKREDPVKIKILRSTELFDMYGKEIFEDDIVRMRGDGMDFTGVVTFRNGGFCVVDSLEYPSITRYQFSSHEYNTEIVSDIYEHIRMRNEE